MEVMSRAEYSPWMLEYQRIDVLLRNLHDSYLDLTIKPEESLRMYDLLREMWRVLKPRVRVAKTSRYNKLKMNDRLALVKEGVIADMHLISEQKRKILSDGTMKQIDDFYDDLYEVRQMVGMGIPMYATERPSDAVKRVMSGPM